MTSDGGTSRRSARERLLEAADRLFYTEGIRTVGIDRVLDESGVAKGSLYYNFGGKDDLVRTYLQNRHAKWAARLAEDLATKDFRSWLHKLFGALVEEAGYPPRLANQLVLLYDGANIAAAMDADAHAAEDAQAAAEALLAASAHARRPGGRK